MDYGPLMADDPTPGISGGGRLAERLFCEITGADAAPRASAGDAVLEGNLVEIKQASTNTLNQVRPLKYLPLVVYQSVRQSWYVVPAHELVRLATAKARGHHNEIAYECAQFSLSALGEFEVDEGQLRERTPRAIEESAAYPDLREEMVRVLGIARSTAAEAREQVRDTLRRSALRREPGATTAVGTRADLDLRHWI
jgi:hypothetical protein